MRTRVFIKSESRDSMILDSFVRSSMLASMLDSRLKLIAGKLRSRWDGPFIITDIFPYSVVQVKDEATDRVFKVNGHQLKLFYGVPPDEKRHDVVDLALIPPMMVEEVPHLAP